jgi:hypothetical protein
MNYDLRFYLPTDQVSVFSTYQNAPANESRPSGPGRIENVWVNRITVGTSKRRHGICSVNLPNCLTHGLQTSYYRTQRVDSPLCRG